MKEFTSARQFRDYLKNKERKYNLPPNTLINYYMMESFILRLTNSQYRNYFIIKGGFLLSSIFGVDIRSTRDIDATVKGLPIDSDKIKEIIEEIISLKLDDVEWSIEKITSIHQSGKYQDFRITLFGKIFNVQEPIKIDITTGDEIFPTELNYKYKSIFDSEQTYDIKTYSYENVIAEKIETILSRNITNTRARDFYDIYMFSKLDNYLNYDLLKKAIKLKFKERNSLFYLENYLRFLEDINSSEELEKQWNAYRNKYTYAREITWQEVLNELNKIIEKVKN